MRYTRLEKEQMFEAIAYYDDLSQQGKTDRSQDEIETLHSAFLKMRMEIKGF
jgi:hypothetical protein